jgi:hypothetical protein
MATLQDVQAKLAAIEQRKAQTLKDLQAKRAKLKAQLAQLQRPTKSQRRMDARRKILLGAFVLEQLERIGSSPQVLTFEGQRFFDWLVRPTDRAVFDVPPTGDSVPDVPPPAPGATAAVTILNVPFAAKDQAKALGAQWQPDKKRWVVPAGLDLTPFQPWLEPTA